MNSSDRIARILRHNTNSCAGDISLVYQVCFFLSFLSFAVGNPVAPRAPERIRHYPYPAASSWRRVNRGVNYGTLKTEYDQRKTSINRGTNHKVASRRVFLSVFRRFVDCSRMKSALKEKFILIIQILRQIHRRSYQIYE
mgnify:CR=1 FL=1